MLIVVLKKLVRMKDETEVSSDTVRNKSAEASIKTEKRTMAVEEKLPDQGNSIIEDDQYKPSEEESF